jgi:hypothetical protein
MIKAFYSDISEIIRRYIEGRYFIPALEETSREILKELKDQDITEDMLINAKEILELSDLVKFAKYKPSDKEHISVVDWTRKFIEGTMVIFTNQEDSDIADDIQNGGIKIAEEITEK